MGLEEESTGEGHPHPPASGEVFTLLLLHGGRELEAVEDVSCLGLGCVRAEVVQSLVDLHEVLLALVVLAGGELLRQLLQLDPLLVSLHDALQRSLLAGGHLAGEVVDVDVLLDGHLPVTEDCQQGRLSTTVFTNKSVSKRRYNFKFKQLFPFTHTHLFPTLNSSLVSCSRFAP